MIEQDVDGEMSPRFSKPADKVSAPAGRGRACRASGPPHLLLPPRPASKGRKPGPRGAKRDAHAQVDEETLDQTLEILGANTLEITNDSAGNTGVRHLRVKSTRRARSSPR